MPAKNLRNRVAQASACVVLNHAGVGESTQTEVCATKTALYRTATRHSERIIMGGDPVAFEEMRVEAKTPAAVPATADHISARGRLP